MPNLYNADCNHCQNRRRLENTILGFSLALLGLGIIFASSGQLIGDIIYFLTGPKLRFAFFGSSIFTLGAIKLTDNLSNQNNYWQKLKNFANQNKITAFCLISSIIIANPFFFIMGGLSGLLLDAVFAKPLDYTIKTYAKFLNIIFGIFNLRTRQDFINNIKANPILSFCAALTAIGTGYIIYLNAALIIGIITQINLTCANSMLLFGNIITANFNGGHVVAAFLQSLAAMFTGLTTLLIPSGLIALSTNMTISFGRFLADLWHGRNYAHEPNNNTPAVFPASPNPAPAPAPQPAVPKSPAPVSPPPNVLPSPSNSPGH